MLYLAFTLANANLANNGQDLQTETFFDELSGQWTVKRKIS